MWNVYSGSSCCCATKSAFAWDQLVVIWQVIGRLVRGGVVRRLDGFYEAILSLYAKGLTTGEISAHLADVYDADVSRAGRLRFIGCRRTSVRPVCLLPDTTSALRPPPYEPCNLVTVRTQSRPVAHQPLPISGGSMRFSV